MSYLNKRCTHLTKPLFGSDVFTSKIKTIITILFLSSLFFTAKIFGQAADIDQIRNGSASGRISPSDWVNGNAGPSNAHYAEGYGIAYRMKVTGLTLGVHTLIIEWDTKHSGGHALDFVTRYDYLDNPAGSHQGTFGHDPEELNPLRGLSGTFSAPSTRAFPRPSSTGSSMAGEPSATWDALASDAYMTIYNGTISATGMSYDFEQPASNANTTSSTRLRIVFTASASTVVFAWSGHIATQATWGIGQGASGVSGSPYHTRLISIDGSGGNQDRSLKASAVIIPPYCTVDGPRVACPETASLTYTSTTDAAANGAVTYAWSIPSATNTANAVISGSSTGNSITVTPNPSSSDFTPGGHFNVKLIVTRSGISHTCYLGSDVSPGDNVEITDVQVSAGGDLAIDLNNSTSVSLGVQSISPGTTADYNFQWKLVSQPTGANSSFTNGTSASATFNVLSPFVQGDYFVRVVATQKAAPYCKDSSNVKIVVGGGVACIVKGPSPVCPGSQDNVYFYDSDGDGDEDPIPSDFDALWRFVGDHPYASFDGDLNGASVKVDVSPLSASCNTTYTVELFLKSKAGSTENSCRKTVSVQDNEPPVITVCPADQNLECGASIAPASTGFPTFTDNCSADTSHTDVTVSNCNRTVVTRTWTVKDTCGNVATCIQIITLTDSKAPTITCPADKTGTSALANGAFTLPANTGTATATDDCTGTTGIIIYYKDVPAINVPNGGITRTWYAVDQSGNSASCVQNIAFVSTTSSLRVSNTEQTAVVSSTKGAVTEVVKEVNKSSLIMAAKPVTSALQGIKVTAFPNPFTNKVTFRLASDVSGRAILEVYNNQGQQLGVVYEGMIKAGINQDVQYNASKISSGILLYRLRVNDKSVNGKLNQLK